MTDEGAGGDLRPLVDIHDPATPTSSATVWSGRIFDVTQETFALPGAGGEVTRDVVRHQGAVAVLTLDEKGRVLVIQQYRHPVGLREWELPAGLLDVVGEPALTCAQRELYEEADLVAAQWHLLLDYLSSPGFTDEGLRIYLARGLTPVPVADRFVRHGEELGMPTQWVPLDELHDAVLRGEVGNAALIIGVLAAQAGREREWSTLRPADTPLPFP